MNAPSREELLISVLADMLVRATGTSQLVPPRRSPAPPPCSPRPKRLPAARAGCR